MNLFFVVIINNVIDILCVRASIVHISYGNSLCLFVCPSVHPGVTSQYRSKRFLVFTIW